MPTVMNAANEEAVAAFLDGKIRFTAITELIEKAMENHDKSVSSEKLTLEAVLNAEKEAREYVRRNLDEYR
jgi:1-deoxy-D-xylulose-5-phosphate reductoisomerase